MIEPVSWITLKTTSARWKADLMQQLLAAHEIPTGFSISELVLIWGKEVQQLCKFTHKIAGVPYFC
jgi:hypothetical protein